MADRRKNRIYFRFNRDGFLYPADNYAASQLRSRGYKNGDVVAVNITKLRSPGFNRLAHKIGQLVVANIYAFHGMDAHKALKRLQLEANAACEEVVVDIKTSGWRDFIKWVFGVMPSNLLTYIENAFGIHLKRNGTAIMRIPKSLSFESLDEGEFNEAIKKICNHIVDRYWPTETPDAIERMAMQWVEAA